MRGVIANAKCHTDHLRHAFPSPHLAAEAIGFGATVQRVGQPRQRRGRPPAGCARRGLTAQRLGAAQVGALQPLADRGGADPQSLGHVPLEPTLLPEMPGLQAACFFPVVRCRVHAWQGST
jgi:hypothetical protein